MILIKSILTKKNVYFRLEQLEQGWFTPTRVLLARCKWLSVRQLVYYQTAILAYKVMTVGTFKTKLRQWIRQNIPLIYELTEKPLYYL